MPLVSLPPARSSRAVTLSQQLRKIASGVRCRRHTHFYSTSKVIFLWGLVWTEVKRAMYICLPLLISPKSFAYALQGHTLYTVCTVTVLILVSYTQQARRAVLLIFVFADRCTAYGLIRFYTVIIRSIQTAVSTVCCRWSSSHTSHPSSPPCGCGHVPHSFYPDIKSNINSSVTESQIDMQCRGGIRV